MSRKELYSRRSIGKLINKAPIPLRPHQVDQAAESRLHRPPSPIFQFQRGKAIPLDPEKMYPAVLRSLVRRFYECRFAIS